VANKGREPKGGINNISIEEFADYVIDLGWNVSTDLQLTMDSHWRPVNLLCRPCHVSYDYYSWAETAKEDADYLFQKFGFPPSVHFPWENESSKPTNVSSRNVLKDYLSQLSDRQLNQLISVYQADYEIFNFDLAGTL
jgi:hypothetical protein